VELADGTRRALSAREKDNPKSIPLGGALTRSAVLLPRAYENRGVQHRPGGAVHGQGVSRAGGGCRDAGEHGRGRYLDNVFAERLWRTMKHEDVFLRGYESVPELERRLRAYFTFYNEPGRTSRWGTRPRPRCTGRDGQKSRRKSS
jgi:hypothetical protein